MIENGDWTLALEVHPPTGKDQHGRYRHRRAIEGGEFVGEPSGIVLGLVEAMAVGWHRMREDELLAIENEFVALLAVGRDSAGLAAALGFDGENPGGR